MSKRIEQKYKYTVSNAEKRNLNVEITHEYLNELFVKQNGKCAITGQLLTCNKSLCDISIDRIDSNKHYTIDNVQLVLDQANQRKGDLTNNELANWSNTIRKSPLFLSQLTKN
jgi:CRISPR/Cas system Type II protein with McrA/HNH and RuvC-like nuclease domain